MASPVPYTPSNQTERDVLEILNRLRQGVPLGGLDRTGTIIRRGTESPESLVKALVTQSRREGATSRREVIWIIGPRGGGKTERLTALQAQLRVEESHSDYGKSAITFIDLKSYPQSQIEDGLQSEIFGAITSTTSVPTAEKIAPIVSGVLESRGANKTRANLVGLGLDILFSASGVPLPGASTFATIVGSDLLSRTLRAYRLRDAALRGTLAKHGITDREASDLILHWVRYATDPTEERWRNLHDAFQRLASRGALFTVLCHVLAACGYSTLVLLFDEVDRIMEGIKSTQGFERLWDKPHDGDPYFHKLNIVFVMAASNPVDELRDETRYSGFSRRFMGTPEVPAKEFRLPMPQVRPLAGQNDDFAHAVQTITGLIGTLTNVKPIEVSAEDELALRQTLLAPGNELTWHRLWAAVSTLYNPLR